MKSLKLVLLFATVLLLSFSFNNHKPVLYIIGDSTVKNGDGSSNHLLQGWGSFINGFFDTTKIGIGNHAISAFLFAQFELDRTVLEICKENMSLFQIL